MVFTGTFPKKEKLIDIGFLTVVFLRNLDQFLTGRFGLDLDFLVFPGYLDIYINQLLTQNYTRGTACTMAFLPFFNLMVNTAVFVNDRIFLSYNDAVRYRKYTRVMDLLYDHLF